MLLTKIKPAQFFGIEINPFAVKVLKVCFLLIELKMSGKLIDISVLDKNIITANALRMDWNGLLPNKKCSYIISNPPFAGKKSKAQLKDIKICFNNTDIKSGTLDYVTCWYKKSSDYIKNTGIECCFLSTNSIVQGTQPAILWKYLLEDKGIFINFAYKSFKWKNKTTEKAAQVFVIIIGFSYKERPKKFLYSVSKNNNLASEPVNYINGYLTKGKCFYIRNLKLPLDNRERMFNGVDYVDNGIYKLSLKEKLSLVKKEPFSEEYIHPYFNGRDLLDNKTNFYLWFQNKNLFNLKKCPTIINKIKKVTEYRSKCREGTQKYADKPLKPVKLRYYSNKMLEKLLVFCCTFSSKYEYIPVKYVPRGTIVSKNLMIIPNASKFTFGIIESKIHMFWAKRFAGRLGDSISYSNGTVYNTFPLTNLTKKQKEDIEKTAKMILDARKLYPKCTLAQLYDPLNMPPELRKAHKLNDEAVLKAYGFSKNITEEECVAKLMEMYKGLVKEEK